MERRKNYFINRQFQEKFIIKFCLLVIAGALISGSLIYAMSAKTVTTVFENSRLEIKNTADYILPAVFLSGILMIGLIGLATIVVTLFTSHRIAGPLYALERDIKEIARGNLAVSFHLRTGDEIKPLAEALNFMTEALRSRILSLRQEISAMENDARSFGSDAGQKIEPHIKNIKTKIAEFNV